MLLAVPGVALIAHPPAASAQALGTLQVSAEVSPAPAAWPTLAATEELVAIAAETRGSSPVEVGLARLELEGDRRDGRRVRVRVDYLRN